MNPEPRTLHSALFWSARQVMANTLGTFRNAGLVVVLLWSAIAHAQAPATPEQAPAAPQQPPAGRGRSAYQDAARLPVRIVSFTAEPSTVQQGQSVTLTWATENPGTITIDQNIGRVTPRGSRSVSPMVTTTYTLTATGVGGPVTRSLTITIPGTVAVASGASEPATSATKRPAPRTADGKPDFTGVYGYGQGAGRGEPPPPTDGGLPRTPTLKPGAEKYRVVRGPNDTGQ